MVQPAIRDIRIEAGMFGTKEGLNADLEMADGDATACSTPIERVFVLVLFPQWRC